MKRFLKITILTVLISFFWSCEDSKTQKGELNDFIPENASVVLKISDFETLKAEIAGSGDIKLYGNTENVTIAIEGSGDVSAYEFKSENAKVSIAGSGDVKLFVTEQIDAFIAGSGDISYKGNPKNIEKSIAGSGTISQE